MADASLDDFFAKKDKSKKKSKSSKMTPSDIIAKTDEPTKKKKTKKDKEKTQTSSTISSGDAIGVIVNPEEVLDLLLKSTPPVFISFCFVHVPVFVTNSVTKCCARLLLFCQFCFISNFLFLSVKVFAFLLFH